MFGVWALEGFIQSHATFEPRGIELVSAYYTKAFACTDYVWYSQNTSNKSSVFNVVIRKIENGFGGDWQSFAFCMYQQVTNSVLFSPHSHVVSHKDRFCLSAYYKLWSYHSQSTSSTICSPQKLTIFREQNRTKVVFF